MKNFDSTLKEIKNDKMDYGTGIWPYVNNKFSISLNEYGEYETYVKNSNTHFTDEEITLLKQVNCLLSPLDESKIACDLFERIPGIKYDNKIGFFTDLYVGYVKEGEYRKNASSGGFGTWIFAELLKLKLIDSVIHVKKSANSEKLFEYSISRTEEEIISGAKTKYYPVELSEMLNIIRNNPGKYAVIGLPSFVMELRLLCKVDDVIKDRIKFLIGLVCGHQKSAKFADLLAWQCGIKPGNIESIDFRKKLDYGPSSSYAIEVRGLINGESQTVVKEMKDIYGGDWGKGLFKIRASDFSDDVMNETADITLGDAWLPEYTKDNKGNNIIVIRNPIISQIIKKAHKEGRLKLDSVNEDTIYRSQISHYRHSYDELGYRLYKKKKQGKWVPEKRVEPTNNIPFIRKRIQDIRENICLNAPEIFNQAINKDDLNFFIRKLEIRDFEYRVLYKFLGIHRKMSKIIKYKK